jgi:hypothetical protein
MKRRPLRDARRKRERRLSLTNEGHCIPAARALRAAVVLRTRGGVGQRGIRRLNLPKAVGGVRLGGAQLASADAPQHRWSGARAAGTRRFVDVWVELERQLAVRGLQRLGCRNEAWRVSKAPQTSAPVRAAFARERERSATRPTHRLRSCRLPERRNSPRRRPRPPRRAQRPCKLCAFRQRPAKRPRAAPLGALRAAARSRATRATRVRTPQRRAHGCGAHWTYRPALPAPRTGPTPVPTAWAQGNAATAAKRRNGRRAACCHAGNRVYRR